MITRSGRAIRDLWIYFKTSHREYLVFTLSMLNFVLQHRLLISYILFLSHYISRLNTFITLFAVTYIPLAMAIGYFEFRKERSQGGLCSTFTPRKHWKQA